jgi:hypothetical protein
MIDREWKPIEGYEGLYEVSNLGEVKSLERLDSRGHHRKEKLQKPQKDSNGYLFVNLYKDGIKKPFLIHRLVYSAFVDEIPPKWDINHLDENKENNHLENLEACSHGDNMRWGTGIARMTAALSKAVQALNKSTNEVVMEFPSAKEAQRQGFHQGSISECCNGKRKTHKGFIWRYSEK